MHMHVATPVPFAHGRNWLAVRRVLCGVCGTGCCVGAASACACTPCVELSCATVFLTRRLRRVAAKDTGDAVATVGDCGVLVCCVAIAHCVARVRTLFCNTL